MNSSRRLSLRARMLILLIAVTAIFLLIMGAVTTAVLSKRVSNVFTADLIAEATRSPAKLADNTDGYLAVAVSVRTGQIVQITPGQQTSGLGAALSQLSLAEYRAQFAHQPTTITTTGGQKVRIPAPP
jgi:hypothetical protein